MATPDAYGTLIEPATLRIQRLLPGPIERVWEWLTDSELRRKWLAAGPMQGPAGTSVELVWRNEELACPPGPRPAGFPEENRMQCVIREFDPPRRLTFTWSDTGDVTFELQPAGKDVQLTLTHRRIAARSTQLNVGAGWHMHLDLLVANATGAAAQPFWQGWQKLKADYEARWPA